MLVGSERDAGRKLGVAEGVASHSYTLNGDGDISGVLQSDVLRCGGFYGLIAEIDGGGCDGKTGGCFFGAARETNDERQIGSIRGDVECCRGIARGRGSERERVGKTTGGRKGVRNGRAGEGELGIGKGHPSDLDRSCAGVGQLQRLGSGLANDDVVEV